MFGGHKTIAMVISIVWESCGMTVSSRSTL